VNYKHSQSNPSSALPGIASGSKELEFTIVCKYIYIFRRFRHFLS
jgi:hypothetical protein